VTFPPRLDKELAELREQYAIETVEEKESIILVIQGFQLGDGFTKSASDLLLQIPRSYPDAGPDMFWVDEDVRLASGELPQAAEATTEIHGRIRRRFSWHRARWNPTIDNLHGHLEFIRKRLREKK